MLRTLSTASLLLTLLARPSSAQPSPPWLLKDYPSRASLTTPAEFLLVTIPAETPSNIAAFDRQGNRLLHRTVHTNSSNISILIHFPQYETGNRKCFVYYGSTNTLTIPMPDPSTPYAQPPPKPSETAENPTPAEVTPQPEPAPAGPLHDPLPVSLTTYSSPVRNIPTSLEKMLFLFNMNETQNDISLHADFGHISLSNDTPRGQGKRRREPPPERRIIALRSVVLCPQTGIYRFALDCKDAGFILLDGKIVADWPGEHGPGFWQPGIPVMLKAGPHRIELFNCAQRYAEAHVGWQLPEQSEPSPIPAHALITASTATNIRTEHRNKTLQPHFSWKKQPAYSFRGNPAVFVPVKFSDLTKNWTNSSVNLSWRFGDGSTAEGKNPVHVYSTPEQYTVTLKATDSRGSVETCRHTLDLRLTRTREHAVSSEIISLPAVCFSREIIEPALLFSGTFPDQVSMKASWTVTTLAGEKTEFNKSFSTPHEPLRIPLLKNTAGSLDTVEWRIDHHGILIDSGTILFASPASHPVPTRVEGDRLYDKKNRQLVLVTSNHSREKRRPPPLTDRVVCIDDMLATPAVMFPDDKKTFYEMLADMHPDTSVKYVELTPWNDFENAHGPLLKLTLIPASLNPGTDTALLSFGLPDIINNTDPGLFEKHVAAVCDIVCTSMNCPAVLVTPPPYPSDPSRVRRFAVAIRRIAESRNIPVADLYTAFMCSPDRARLFATGHDLALSQNGHRLAAHVIRKTLAAQKVPSK